MARNVRVYEENIEKNSHRRKSVKRSKSNRISQLIAGGLAAITILEIIRRLIKHKHYSLHSIISVWEQKIITFHVVG